MKTRWFVVALCGLLVAPGVRAQSGVPDVHEETKKLLRLLKIHDKVQSHLEAMCGLFAHITADHIKQNWELSTGAKLDPSGYDALLAAVQDECLRHVPPGAADAFLVPIVEKRFTAVEIRDLVRFFELPLGAKLASSVPALGDEIADAGGDLNRRTSDRLEAPEFKAKMAEIIAQYSGSASSEGIVEAVPDPDHDRVASEAVRTPAEPAALDPEQAKKLPSGRVQISGAQAMRLLHWQPSPSYPPVAKKAGIGGAVRFATVIGKDGRVISEQLIFGHPLLVTAAAECIKQWVFRPMSLDGEPVEVETELQIFFHALKQGSRQAW